MAKTTDREVREAGSVSSGSGRKPVVRRISSFEEFTASSKDWDALVLKNPRATVFQLFDWNHSWWSAFGEKSELLLLAAESEDRLIGVAPLMIRNRGPFGLRGNCLKFIGGRETDFGDFVLDPDQGSAALRAFWDWLEANSHLWDSARLESVPEESLLTAGLSSELIGLGFRCWVSKRYDAPTRLLGNREEDLRIVNKKSFRRHFNGLKRRGSLRLLNLQDYEEIEPYLDSFFSQHVRRWDATDTPSQFVDQRSRLFFREMSARLARQQILLFSVLLLDATPLAFHLGFQFRKRLFWYKPTYDIAFSKDSPGEVLLKHLLEFSIEEGFDEFDFTIGPEYYKYRFSNHTRRTFDVSVFKSAGPFHSHRIVSRGKEVLREFPALAVLGKGVQRRWRLFWRRIREAARRDPPPAADKRPSRR